MRSRKNVLIVASDPVLAALLGGLVDAMRFQPVFPGVGEDPDAALARVRPLAVILMEGSSTTAGSQLFVVRARRRGARVMLFGHPASIAPLKEWAAQHDIDAFALPEELERLQDALDGQHPERMTARQGDRRAPLQRNPDGSLHFQDAAGTRWTVYDRRTGDRRAGGVTREFVSDEGERRTCTVGAADASAPSRAELADQLKRSIPASAP
jgi:hypothetical protein